MFPANERRSPAKAVGKPSAEPLLVLGIPKEWVEHLIELGYDSVGN